MIHASWWLVHEERKDGDHNAQRYIVMTVIHRRNLGDLESWIPHIFHDKSPWYNMVQYGTTWYNIGGGY